MAHFLEYITTNQTFLVFLINQRKLTPLQFHHLGHPKIHIYAVNEFIKHI